MNERRLREPMPDTIVASQRAASDPAESVWVRANAGSGKTYVLTARVLRLLLSGARPDEILCLTYTKAAAAEMRSRVAGRLGRWALAPDDLLTKELTELSGAPPTEKAMLRARALFAHALETPGGLRIQTIHAFCESVLHRFPREAGVPFDFAVLEEHERDGMLRKAREAVVAAGLRGGGEASAVETLFGLMSDFQIETAIVEALNQQRTLRGILTDLPAAKRELRRRLGPVDPVEDILAEMTAGYGLDRADHEAIFALSPPNPDGNTFVDKLAAVDPERPDPDDLTAAYLTQSGTARRTLIKKSLALMIPEIAERAEREAARLEALSGERVAAELLARSEAMLDIVAAISRHYEDAKRARALLDFDDLIEKLAALLKDTAQGDWVRYKLDAGLSHILVDEGQDTNFRQWEVIGALIDDFFVGESAADRPRTLFAVGDQKQSIFSFQGADPNVFIEAGRQFTFSALAARFEIADVPLHYSFRTLPKILEAVDIVFAREDLHAGSLEDKALRHDTARADAGGMVTLWPPIRDVAEETDPDNWPTEPPLIATQSAQRQIAERIAREIGQWIDTRRPLGPRGRPVRADDVLILVQVRSILFHEIIRALIRAGIPTPGADRLAVTTHIGVLDLMALGDVLSNPADSLQLAALLRSPLFDVSEEDLLAVATPRDKHDSLWDAIRRSDIASIRAAHEQLRGWRDRLDFDRPFNFFADVLYASGGLRRMRGRFGSEIDDVVGEFLDLALLHEQSEQPSLLGFLAELRSRDVTIKRDLAEAGSGVRVMTVHGAKGLEAPIVILADAASAEKGRNRRCIYMRSDPPLFVHAASEATHVAQTMEYRAIAEAEERAEYWRKLYVAMTRAEDELYVTGYLTKQGKDDESWYRAIAKGLGPLSEERLDESGAVSALVYPAERPAAAPLKAAAAVVAAPAPALPGILPAHVPVPIVRPSSAFEPRGDGLRALATAAESSVDAETARREGIALHALLQHLVKIGDKDRARIAERALEILLPAGTADRRAALAAKAISILGRPAFAEIFGPDSRAEVPFLAKASRNGKDVMLAGRIDRLVVTPAHVTIVDFKSDRTPPGEGEPVPAAYLTQLGLYALVATQLFPHLEVRPCILWTSLESLLKLDAEEVRKAASAFTMR